MRLTTGLLIALFGMATSTLAEPSDKAAIWDNPPKEIIPADDPSLIEKLSNQPPLNARLQRAASGEMAVYVDDVEVPLIAGNIAMSARDLLQVKGWKDAGIPLLAVYLDVGVYNPRLGYQSPLLYQAKPFWDGQNRFHPEQVSEVLERIVKVYPEAYILLCLRMDAYPEWPKENPGEVMRNEEGQAFFGSTHFQGVGKSTAAMDKELWSFSSKVFRKDASEAISELVKTVEAVPWGKRVIGYWIGGGYDGQLYFWQPPSSTRQGRPEFWGDYSEPARAAWAEWLRERYVSIEKLNAAWSSAYTDWSQAAPPASKSLAGSELFFDPRKEAAEIDWRSFSSSARNSLISDFARAIRKASTRSLVIGAPAGDSGARSDLTSNADLIQDPALDFYTHQPGYNHRLPPAPGGVNAILGSYQANGKIFLADLDFRTWLSKPTNQKIGTGIGTITDDYVGRASNIEQLRSMWRRELGRLWTQGAGGWLNPLGNAWAFSDPEIQNELRLLRASAPAREHPQGVVLRPDVILIYDERSVDFLRGAHKLHGLWAVEQRRQLDLSGLAWQACYLKDLVAGRVPKARMIIFQNLLRLDEATRAAIAKLQSNGRTLVFLQGVGYGSPDVSDAVLTDTVGMSLGLLGKEVGAQAEPVDSKPQAAEIKVSSPELHEVTGYERFVKDLLAALLALGKSLGLLGKEMGAQAEPADSKPQAVEIKISSSDLYEVPGYSRVVKDPLAAKFAHYEKSRQEAAGVRKHKDWTSVFVGSNLLDSKTVNHLAKNAGAWVATGPGIGVAAGNSLLMLYPTLSGPVEVTLPEEASLQEIEPGKLKSDAGKHHVLDLRVGETYLFRANKPNK